MEIGRFFIVLVVLGSISEETTTTTKHEKSVYMLFVGIDVW